MTREELESEYSVEVVDIDLSKGCPVAKDIYYACKKCGSVVPSMPDDSMGCSCRNIFIDVDYARVSIKDESSVEVLKVAPKGGFLRSVFSR